MIYLETAKRLENNPSKLNFLISTQHLKSAMIILS